MDRIKEIARRFEIAGEPEIPVHYGNGHINDTYLVVCGKKRYILQRISQAVFKAPELLMKNVQGVTEFMREKIAARGGDPERETLNLVPLKTGGKWYVDGDGEYWRVYDFIERTVAMEQVTCPEDFYKSALAFGGFQSALSDYPAETLFETIPRFHDTPNRFSDFRRAIEEDRSGRAHEVGAEIESALSREAGAGVLMDMLKSGELPLRVTHNDTKLNNVLFDDVTHEGICVIDLDTVMPGIAVNDFADSIRFGASTAVEDERDLSKVTMDLGLYELYLKGFLAACGDKLTEAEKRMLPMGAKLITLENAIRFLGDHLNGDVYYHIAREGHNLDRARTQLKLVADMEKKWDEMNALVDKYI